MKATPLSQMRDLVTIQSPTRTQDSFGQMVVAWNDLDTVWCNITPLSGQETYFGGSVRADTTHGVTMRYYGGLVPSYRLKWTDKGTTKYLNVLAALDVESRGRTHALQCKEVL